MDGFLTGNKAPTAEDFKCGCSAASRFRRRIRVTRARAAPGPPSPSCRPTGRGWRRRPVRRISRARAVHARCALTIRARRCAARRSWRRAGDVAGPRERAGADGRHHLPHGPRAALALLAADVRRTKGASPVQSGRADALAARADVARCTPQRVVPPALDLFDPRCPKARPSRRRLGTPPLES